MGLTRQCKERSQGRRGRASTGMYGSETVAKGSRRARAPAALRTARSNEYRDVRKRDRSQGLPVRTRACRPSDGEVKRVQGWRDRPSPGTGRQGRTKSAPSDQSGTPHGVRAERVRPPGRARTRALLYGRKADRPSHEPSSEALPAISGSLTISPENGTRGYAHTGAPAGNPVDISHCCCLP
jgi:hypothetical protein